MSDVVILKGDEVISVDRSWNFTNNGLVKIQDMTKRVEQSCQSSVTHYKDLTSGEIQGEVLRPGHNWQTGSFKLVVSYHVEFTPNLPVPESPLDDLRSNLDI